MTETQAHQPARKCGYVAIVGAPNAGKSTLTNRLVGAKVSIVTPKVQTTRMRITAIAISGPAQLIFLDTPGIFREPKRRLERAMVNAAWRSADDADIVVLLIDAKRGRDKNSNTIIDSLKQSGRKAILALNKIDTVQPGSLLGLAEDLNGAGIFTDIFMISALDGSGVDALEECLAQAVPEGTWLYPEDQLADMPERLLAAEVTRERLFLELHDELPYSLTVETEAWKERPGGQRSFPRVRSKRTALRMLRRSPARATAPARDLRPGGSPRGPSVCKSWSGSSSGSPRVPA